MKGFGHVESRGGVGVSGAPCGAGCRADDDLLAGVPTPRARLPG